jgi:hypothetical protein
MEKVRLRLDELLVACGFMVMVLWLGIIILVGVALRFALSR